MGPLRNKTRAINFVWRGRLPSHDGERRSGGRENVQTGPTCDELIMGYRRVHFLPSTGLKAGESSAFEPICEMLGHQSFIRSIVFLCAKRHLV